MRVLRQVRVEHGNGLGMLDKIYAKMQLRDSVTVSYRATMYKVQKVDHALAVNPHLSVDEIMDGRINDRLSRDVKACTIRRDS